MDRQFVSIVHGFLRKLYSQVKHVLLFDIFICLTTINWCQTLQYDYSMDDYSMDGDGPSLPVRNTMTEHRNNATSVAMAGSGADSESNSDSDSDGLDSNSNDATMSNLCASSPDTICYNSEDNSDDNDTETMRRLQAYSRILNLPLPGVGYAYCERRCPTPTPSPASAELSDEPSEEIQVLDDAQDEPSESSEEIQLLDDAQPQPEPEPDGPDDDSNFDPIFDDTPDTQVGDGNEVDDLPTVELPSSSSAALADVRHFPISPKRRRLRHLMCD